MSKICKILVVFMAVLTVVASSPAQAANRPYEGVKLNFLLISGHHAGLDELLPEFEKETGMKVNLISVSMPDLYTKLGTEFAAGGQSYDVSETMFAAAQGFARGNNLLILDDLIKKYNIDVNKFTSVYIKNHMIQYPQTAEGKYVCLPHQSGLQILAYRRDLFENPAEKAAYKARYGTDLAVPKTLAEFKQVAEFFTRDTDYDGRNDLFGTVAMGKNFPALVGDITPYLRAFGGDWLDKNFKPIINTPESLAGMKYYYDLFATAKVTPPGCATYAWDEEIADFQNGRLAMMIIWPNHTVSLENPQISKVAGKIGYAVVPGQNPVVGGWAVAIPAKAKNPEASFAFINWLLSDKVALTRAQTTGFTTSAQIIFDDPIMKEKYVYLQAVKESLPYGKGWPQIGEFTSIWKIGAQELSRAFAGEITVEQAADNMQKSLDQLMKDGGYY